MVRYGQPLPNLPYHSIIFISIIKTQPLISTLAGPSMNYNDFMLIISLLMTLLIRVLLIITPTTSRT